MHRFHTLQYNKRNETYFIWIRRGGVSKYFNFGPNRKKAQEQLRQLEQNLASGTVTLSSIDTSKTLTSDGKKDMRIEELIHRHLEWVEANRSAGSLRNRINYLLQFKEFVGEIMVSQITRSLLEAFYQWAKKGKSRSENGGNQHLSHVKTMLRWGEEMEIIDLPFKRFPKMNYTPPALNRIDATTWELILSNAEPDFRDMLEFGLLTGLRPREIRILRQSDVVYMPDKGPCILIEKHKTLKSARTHQPRSVPLRPKAEAIFLRQTEAHPKSDYVFLNQNGEPYKGKAFNDRFERLCLKLRIPKIKPYDLRHESLSALSDSGVETTALASIAGHTTTRTLMRYVKNTYDHHVKAMDNLEKNLLPILSAERKENKEEKASGEETGKVANETCHGRKKDLRVFPVSP